MNEDEIKQWIRQVFGLRRYLTLFTNPVGNGWVGVESGRVQDTIRLKNPRRIEYGLRKGSSDLIGWLSFALNGFKISVFVALEVKTKTGKATEEQLHFIQKVKESGGIAGIVRSPLDVELLILEWCKDRGFGYSPEEGVIAA